MILSHHHRFIFIKPRKTAGSSVEVALSRLLEPGDYATSLAVNEEPLRVVKPGVRVGSGWLWPQEWFQRPRRLRNHSSLHKVYGVFAQQVRDYKVVSMTRNPWDRAVSLFYFHTRHTPIRQQDLSVQKAAFQRFTRTFGPRNWLDPFCVYKRERTLDSARVLYFHDGRCCADYVIRFESLEQDLAQLQGYLGLPEKPSVQNIHLKMGIRPAATRRNWMEMYDEETRALVAKCCQWEIEQFGYDFYGENEPAGPLLHKTAPTQYDRGDHALQKAG